MSRIYTKPKKNRLVKGRKKQNRRVITSDPEKTNRQVVRGGLTFLGFFAIFTCFVLVTWVAGKMADPRTLPIKAVKVEGDFRYLATENLQRVVAENVKGGFFSLDIDQIRSAVLSAPWVREVTVRKLWPETLYVKIKEQTAVVRWRTTGFLNHKGELFEPEDISKPEGLIRLNGPAGTEQLVFEKYKVLMGLLSPKNRNVAWLELNERRGWSFEIKQGPMVIVGRKEVDKRLWKYVKSVEKSFGKDIENIAQIDLRYTNGFTVRVHDENDVEESTEKLTGTVSKKDSRGT